MSTTTITICPLVVHMKGADKDCEHPNTQERYRNEHPGCECHNGTVCLAHRAYLEMANREIHDAELKKIRLTQGKKAFMFAQA